MMTFSIIKVSKSILSMMAVSITLRESTQPSMKTWGTTKL
jgi:hypothetical protein